MPTATKEKSVTQIRIQAREEKIIQCALEIINESGFAALRMENLHKRAECTKGTLYNHFINREDLLCEIATRYCISLMSYYERLDAFKGSTRERIMALFLAYQIYCFSHPALFTCVLQLQNPSLMARGSEKRLNNYRKEEMRLVLHMTNIIQDALDAGDIDAKYKTKVFELAFTGWASAFGNISLMMSSQGAFLTQQADKEEQLFFATNMALDGLGWQPLSTDFNYLKTWQKLGCQFFKTELTKLRQP
ncbi:MAG: TetR/AcrR family transcriptional regulator [Pseudomonadales bacterium]|nr:TetR/AcrR family transcriptional regulator [Pseudomonadales bacterium]